MGGNMHQLMTFLLIGCALTLFMQVHGSLLQTLKTNRLRPGLSTSRQLVFTPEILSLQSLPLHANLGPRSSFRYHNDHIHKSAKGVKRVRLIQTYGGYDVFGSSVEAELDANEMFTGQMYGHVIKNLHSSIRDPEVCRRNLKRLQMKAIKLEGLSVFDPNIAKLDTQRIVYPIPEKNMVRMVYKVSFFYSTKKRVSYPVYFLDACTGTILMSYNKLQTMVATNFPHLKYQRHHMKLNMSMADHDEKVCPVYAVGVGGNDKIGQIVYNEYPHCLNVKKNGETCEMAGSYINTIDNEESTSLDNDKKVNFICDVGYKDPVNGAYGVANDGFYYGENAGALFKEKYKMDMLGYKPRVVVHYSNTYENAFCDGTDTFYGDGGTTFYPLVSVDVVAHELGHAVTDKNSGLMYEEQSGGMNEAFSDILAATATGFLKDTQDIDWLIGADIDKISDALRYMYDPPLDGRSIKSVNDFLEFMDVHYSSGVYNFAFYTMVKLQGMDLFEAFKCFLDANLNYWVPNSDFYTGACDVLRAAYDNGYDLDKVRAGFKNVDINLDNCQYSALPTSMFIGETRENILVSTTRSPVLRIELDQKAISTLVEVIAEGNSNDIHIIVGKDDLATKVITRGNNSVRFHSSRSHVYVQLRSNAKVDVPVVMKISS